VDNVFAHIPLTHTSLVGRSLLCSKLVAPAPRRPRVIDRDLTLANEIKGDDKWQAVSRQDAQFY